MSLLTGLVPYYILGEASGTRADSNGSLNLSENGTVGQSTGKITNCASFPGSTGNYLSHVDTASLSFADLTIQAWVNFADTSGVQVIVGKCGANDREYRLDFDGGSQNLTFGVSSAAGFANLTAVGWPLFPSTSTWYLIHAWLDTANNLLGITVNADGTPVTTGYTHGTYDSGAAFAVGQDPFYAGNFNGLLCEVGVWNRVLTGGERTSLYNSGAGLAYPFASAPVTARSLFRQANLTLGGGGSFFSNPIT